MSKLRIALFLSLLAVGLGLFMLSCDSQTEYIYIEAQEGDTIPPATIDNLAVIDTSYDYVAVAYTVPGDDGMVGETPYVILKKHKGDFSGFIWDQAETVFDMLSYNPPGAPSVHKISDLEMGTTYTFGVKAYDEAGNYSELSNLVQVTTKLSTIDSSGLYVGPGVYALAVADFDDNGYLDIVSCDRQMEDERVVIFKNLGDSGFVAPQYFNPVGSPVAFTTGDFDNDNKADIAVSCFMANQTAIHLNKNGFGTPYPLLQFTRAYALATSDFDHNGFLDVAGCVYDFGEVRAFLNIDGASFNPPLVYDASEHTRGVYAGDLNGDGYDDLAVTSDGGGIVSLLYNKGNGQFNPAVSYNLSGSGYFLDGGDFDDDGDIDLAVAVYSGDSSRVQIMENVGSGVFNRSDYYFLGLHFSDVAVGDMDNDGDLDLVVSSGSYGGNPHILLNNGSGTFSVIENIIYPERCRGLNLADMDNDGKLDIVVVDVGTERIVIVNNPF